MKYPSFTRRLRTSSWVALTTALGAATLLATAPAQAQQTYLSAGNPESPTAAGYGTVSILGIDAGTYFGASCGGANLPCAYNGYGYDGTGFDSTTPFVFNGGYFKTATYSSSTPATSVVFVGSDGTNTYTSHACAINSTSFVFCANTFTSPVTQIVFNTSGGTDAYGGTAGGGYFLANQLTFNGPTSLSMTPEPSSLALLATGLVGLVPAARRKRRR